jgi:hypothetical protein
MSAFTQIKAMGQARNRFIRFLGPISIVVVAALAATGVRTGVGLFQSYQAQRAHAEARQAAHMPIPINPQIEQTWGIRVTLVQLLADHGLVEMRYLVVDSTKATRLHADANSLSNIPWLNVEGSRVAIKSQSVMFHFQHGVGQGLDGRTYSIIYGNANNAIHPDTFVTVVMPDGLQLQHVPVDG